MSDAYPASSAAEMSVAAASTGAFALRAGSKDAAVLMTLTPSAHTVQISGPTGGGGEAMVEIYELP